MSRHDFPLHWSAKDYCGYATIVLDGSMDRESKGSTARRYPAFWEHAVPIFVVVIGILVMGLAAIAASIVLGIFPGSS
jgi:hypothetical protein